MASDESRESNGTRRVRANGFPCTTTRVSNSTTKRFYRRGTEGGCRAADELELEKLPGPMAV